jgi:hypothetical protein
MQVPLVTVSCPSPRNIHPLPHLPLDIKDSLKEDFGLREAFECLRFFDGGFGLKGNC